MDTGHLNHTFRITLGHATQIFYSARIQNVFVMVDTVWNTSSKILETIYIDLDDDSLERAITGYLPGLKKIDLKISHMKAAVLSWVIFLIALQRSNCS